MLSPARQIPGFLSDPDNYRGNATCWLASVRPPSGGPWGYEGGFRSALLEVGFLDQH